mgnify:CR=1 FL=1
MPWPIHAQPVAQWLRHRDTCAAHATTLLSVLCPLPRHRENGIGVETSSPLSNIFVPHAVRLLKRGAFFATPNQSLSNRYRGEPLFDSTEGRTLPLFRSPEWRLSSSTALFLGRSKQLSQKGLGLCRGFRLYTLKVARSISGRFVAESNITNVCTNGIFHG